MNFSDLFIFLALILFLLNNYILRILLIYFWFLGVGLSMEQLQESDQEIENPSYLLEMTLGRGFEPTRPFARMEDCLLDIEVATVSSWKDSQFIKGRFSETRIKTIKDLFRKLSFQENPVAEALWGGESVYFSKYNKFNKNENSFTWVFDFRLDLGYKALLHHKLKLSPQAQALIDSGQLNEFYDMCGTEYIKSVNYGGRFTAVFEIDSKYKRLVSLVESAFKSSSNIDVWGFTGSEKFSSFLNDINFKGVLKKEVNQFGGSRIDIDKIDLENLGYHLKIFQDELNNGKVVPIKLETSSWSNLGIFNINKIISKLYREYRYNLGLIDKIGDHFYWYNNDVFNFDKAELDSLELSKEDLQKQQHIISGLARRCIEEKKCRFEGLNRVHVDFPKKYDKLNRQSTGSFGFQIPKSYSFYGKVSNLGDFFGFTYVFLRKIHRMINVSDYRLIIYEKECKSRKEILHGLFESIATQGVKPIENEFKNRSGVGYSVLFWVRNLNLNEAMLIFDKHPQKNLCPVVKIVMIGDNLNLSSILKEKAINSLIKSVVYL